VPEIPIRRVLIFDYGGLQVVVKFLKGNYKVVLEWSEELSLRGASFVARILEKKTKNIDFLELRPGLSAYIGSKYITVIEHKKLSPTRVRELARKIDALLSSISAITPKDMGEAVARAVKVEFGV